MIIDSFLLAFERGKQARQAQLPRCMNPFANDPNDQVAQRLFNSWEAGWVFGQRDYRAREALAA